MLSNFAGKNDKVYTEKVNKILYYIARKKAPKGFDSFLFNIRSLVSSFLAEFMTYAISAERDHRFSFEENDPE